MNKRTKAFRDATNKFAISHNIKAMADVSGTRRLGKIVKVSMLTTTLKFMKGAKTSFTIKRHNTKHNVSVVTVPCRGVERGV